MPRATRSSTRAKAAPVSPTTPRARTRERRIHQQPEEPAELAEQATANASPEPEPEPEPSRTLRTRQKSNPARKRALQRLMQAIRDGGFDSDLDSSGSDSEPVRRALTRTQRSSRRKKQRPANTEVHSSDSDYVLTGDVEDAEEDKALEEQAAGDEFDLATDAGRQAAAAVEQKHERRRTEKKLILKFKKANLLGEKTSAEERAREGGLALDDIDWSEFDIEMINEILARREALRKRRMGEAAAGSADGEVTTAKLKKSSLAPAPLQLEKVKHAAAEMPSESVAEEAMDGEVVAEDTAAEKTESKHVTTEAYTEEQVSKEDESMAAASEASVEEEVLISATAEVPSEKQPVAESATSDDEEMADVSVDGENPADDMAFASDAALLAAKVISDAMEIDNDADNHQFTDLFEDHTEIPQTPGASLQLPPRAVAMNKISEPAESSITGIRRQNTARRHPALIRAADSQAGAPFDMRLVLQYELQHEDKLLKDLYAEVADQLRKLQTEERLLRMIVKKDFELPDDVMAEDPAIFSMDPAYTSFLDAEHNMHAGEEMDSRDSGEPSDGNESGSESDGSISGMSSSSSSSSGSSDDEVQDEDIARASLGRILTDYMPSNGWPTTE